VYAFDLVYVYKTVNNLIYLSDLQNNITSQIKVFGPDAKPYGLTYGHWVVKWWQWLVSIPLEVNPCIDNDGKYVSTNQTDPHVWFLSGTLGGNAVNRICTVPFGKSILFPVINYEMNSVEKPELKTDLDLMKHVRQDEDDIVNLGALIDGQNVPIYRIQSDPIMFPLSIPVNNTFNVRGGVTTRATSDGYWVFLESLPLGSHNIFFAGSCSAGLRNVKATYDLTVTRAA
jgi:hypothetical protein